MKRFILFLLAALLIAFFVIKFGINHDNSPVEAHENLSGQGCAVLTYHRINKDSFFDKFNGFITNDPQLTTYNIYKSDFDQQMKDLKRNNVEFITPQFLQEYMTKKKTLPSNRKCVLITFDDVDESVYQNAFPILKNYQIPFTVFLIMGQVGNKDYNGVSLADWKQIEEMQKSGLATVGTHTYDLHYLKSNGRPPFLVNKNINAFQKDARSSIKKYEKHFGSKPDYFAYPYGFGTPRTDKVLMDDGYKLIFSLRYGLNKPNDPTFFVKRILLTYKDWDDVKNWIQSK
ncbi:MULTISPECIES: polysaccharide deacetylase family protein [Neobacillus]|uniref:Polysaccharide deacetylase family protein n=1 Tax=Neobacillus rhizophilus TaxID=2833579 RepID=A0A942U3F7_9BACI|nr:MULTISPECIES: polysaccharide deacetylase family protein [Neobacillus]MBS4213940.1 polysaccharide deacetylase family protein [Neobacillus rhizophilus]